MKAAIVAVLLLVCISCSTEQPDAPRTAAPSAQAARPSSTAMPEPSRQPKPKVQSDPNGHIDVTEVAIGEVDGRKVILSAGREGRVHVRDAGTLRSIGKPVPGLAPIEYTVLHGIPLMLVTTRAGTVEAWDLRSRTRRGPALAAGKDTTALTAFEGIAVTWGEGGVKSFDLASGRLRHRLSDWSPGEFLHVTEVEGVPVLLVGTAEFVLTYDLRTGRERGDDELDFPDESGKEDAPPTFEDCEVATIGGHPALLMPTGSYGVRVYDLVTRAFLPWIEQPLTSRFGDETALATYRGRTVVLFAAEPADSIDRDLEGSAEIRAWDPETGRAVTSFPVDGPVSTVAAEGDLVVVGGPDNAVRSYDLAAGREQAVAHGSDTDRTVGLAVDGRFGVAKGYGYDTWQAWDLTTYRKVGAPVTTSSLTSVAIGRHEGRHIVATGHGSKDAVRIWDLESRKELGPALTGFRAGVSAVAVVTVGGRTLIVAAGDGRVEDVTHGGFDDPKAESSLRVWDLKTRAQIYSPMRIGEQQITGLGLSKVNGKPVAVTIGSGSVQVFDLEHGRRIDNWAVSGDPYAMVTGVWRRPPVAVIAADGRVLVKRVATGADVLAPIRSDVPVTAFDMRGSALVVEGDSSCRAVFDLATGRKLVPFTTC